MDLPSGTVKVWNEDKGFGFITPDEGGPDVYVHRSVLTDGNCLIVGSPVIYEANMEPGRDKMTAKRCAGAHSGPPPPTAAAPPSGSWDAASTYPEPGQPPPPSTPPPPQALGAMSTPQPNGFGGSLAPPPPPPPPAAVPPGGGQAWRQESSGETGRSPPPLSSTPPSGMSGGTVKVWYEDKGYGFIVPDSGEPDVFVHRTYLQDGRTLVVGAHVQYSPEWEPTKQKTMAKNLYGATGGPPVGPAPGKQADKGSGKGPAPPAPAAAPPAPSPAPGYSSEAGHQSTAGMQSGKVKLYIEEKGYGFIVPDNGGEDVFVHKRELGEMTLWTGAQIFYEAAWDLAKNKYKAMKVVLASSEAGAPPPPPGDPSGYNSGSAWASNGGGNSSWSGADAGNGTSWGGNYGAAPAPPPQSAPSSAAPYGSAPQPGDKSAGKGQQGDNLFVAGLPAGTSEDIINGVFSAYGPVVSIKVLPANGKPDMAALVRMQDKVMAAWLVENLNGNIPVGLASPVTVRFANTGQAKAGKGSDGKGGPPSAPLAAAAGASQYGSYDAAGAAPDPAYGTQAAPGAQQYAGVVSAPAEASDAVQDAQAAQLAELLEGGGLDSASLVDAAALLASKGYT